MGFFDAFTGAAQKDDINAGYRDSSGFLNAGKDKAVATINRGYSTADARQRAAMSTVNSGYSNALANINGGMSAATSTYAPYMRAGSQANTMYGNALGLNGLDAQKQFGSNYAASDPFRQQNASMASEALLRQLNARGMSGSGYAAEAVARQNLARGSEDYGNYLSRLQGLQGQGLQAAGNMAQMQYGAGQDRANLNTGQAGAVANIYGQRAGAAVNQGNALADLYYGNAQQRANLRTGQANALAANESTGINNLMGLGGLAVKAFTAGMGG